MYCIITFYRLDRPFNYIYIIMLRAWIEMSRGKGKADKYLEKVAGKLRKLLLCVINKVVLSRRRKRRIDLPGILSRRNVEYHVEFRGYRIIFNSSNNFHFSPR